MARGEGIGTSPRVAKATIAEWSTKISEEVTRNLIMVAMLQKKGRVSYGHSGGQHRWVVRKGEHDMAGFPDMVPLNTQRIDTKENAYLPWRGYYTTDTITLREKLEQGGKEAMIKIFNSREKLIRQGVIRKLASEFYVDGNSAAAVAGEKFHGIESMMGVTSASQNATDKIATVNNDTYAGLSTVLGSVAGVVGQTTHPLYRLWTPIIVNTLYNPGTGVQTWADYAIDYIRTMLIRSTIGQGPDDRMDLITLTRDAYETLLNLMDDKERILVQRGSGEELVSLGFRNIVEIDGCPVTWDLAVPGTDSEGDTVQGYGWTTSEMELMVLGNEESKQLFASRLDYNGTYAADVIMLWLLGNIKFGSPRRFGKFVGITP